MSSFRVRFIDGIEYPLICKGCETKQCFSGNINPKCICCMREMHVSENYWNDSNGVWVFKNSIHYHEPESMPQSRPIHEIDIQIQQSRVFPGQSRVFPGQQYGLFPGQSRVFPGQQHVIFPGQQHVIIQEQPMHNISYLDSLSVKPRKYIVTPRKFVTIVEY
jgi:hypothetical protein